MVIIRSHHKQVCDIFVFIFFGLATVLGSIFIVSDNIPRLVDILPAATIGFFSIGVLNINNIRDIETDAATRVTTAIKFGERKSKIYHIVLIASGWICYLAYCLINNSNRVLLLPFVTILLYVLNCIGVWKKSGKGLDPMLPLLVMSTFLFSILFAISI